MYKTEVLISLMFVFRYLEWMDARDNAESRPMYILCGEVEVGKGKRLSTRTMIIDTRPYQPQLPL